MLRPLGVNPNDVMPVRRSFRQEETIARSSPCQHHWWCYRPPFREERARCLGPVIAKGYNVDKLVNAEVESFKASQCDQNK
jgi:hypothetical protein